MATVKMHCPKCFGTGLIGTVQESVCPQCNGTGTISVDDTQTFASTNTTVAALITNGTSLVVP